jgi:hypothetical protein
MLFSNARGMKVPYLFTEGGVFVQTSFSGQPMPPPMSDFLLDNAGLDTFLLDNSGEPLLDN